MGAAPARGVEGVGKALLDLGPRATEMVGLFAQAQNGKPAPPGFEQLREMPGPFGRI